MKDQPMNCDVHKTNNMATNKVNFENVINLFLKNRKNSNFILDLFKNLEINNENLLPTIIALEQLFLQLSKRGDLEIDESLRVTNPEKFAIEDQYVKWLSALYNKYFSHLTLQLLSKDENLRSQATMSIFKLLSAENMRPGNCFPLQKLENTLTGILAWEGKKENVAIHVESYFMYRDVLFHSWIALKNIILKSEDTSDEFTANAIELIDKMKPPKSVDALELFFYNDASSFKEYKENALKSNMQKVWMLMINRNLSSSNLRQLLLVLVESFLPHLPKPTHLVDFMGSSLSLGGPTGLLALQGMSDLVTKHNLECPNIFGKLYNMFQPEIFYTKYKARLFYLANLFLQSTYVPEQLVAAFAKRLSRLSLLAQAPDLVLIMQFVGNLLIRHKALSVLIHSSTSESVDADPFIMDEQDPMKCRAMQSSLWELNLLKNHVQPKVSAAAKFLDANLPSVEWDIRDELDSSYSTMFESEIKKNAKVEPALNFIRPTSIAQLSDDRLYKLWSLT